MPHSRLVVADRANQASTLPALLIATSINESSPTVDIVHEESDLLKEGDKAVVQLTGSSGSSVFGAENAIKALLSEFPFLKAKDEKAVYTYPTEYDDE